MKNALIITTIGGFVPQFEMNDVRILQENGYIVHYASDFENPVYSINQKELEAAGIVLHHIDIRKNPLHIRNNGKAFVQLRRIIRKEEIQLVHCHNPMGGVVGRLAACFAGKKICVLYTAHGFHFYQGAPLRNWLLYYTAERFLALLTDRLITINKEDYRQAERFHLRRRGRAEWIPGVGVDLQKFCPRREQRIPVRKELSIPEGAFHIVSVGELTENKNHEMILKALASLKQRDIYYSICGSGKNRGRLERLIEQYQMSDRVRLLGYRTDVEEVLQSADCFAFPSRREGLGIAAIEAMACGIPVIAADNRGTREYMRHGENGLVCDGGERREFAEAILYMKNSPERRAQMASRSRETAEKFSLAATDKRMRRIYRKLR